MNATDNTVASLLKEEGIDYSAVFVRTAPDAMGGTNGMDEWRVSFNAEEFQFFTGLGLRAPATDRDRAMARRQFPGLTQNDIAHRTLYGRRYLNTVEATRKPLAPSAACVLRCLALDASGAEQSFANWCLDFGYDTDSRKVESTYFECQKAGDKLRRVFSREQIRQIETLLQDY